MRPTRAIAALTLTITTGTGISGITGITGGDSAETIRSSQNATIATPAVDDTPAPHAASPAGTPRTAPQQPVHERRTPSPQPLAPRPPADGRDAPDPFLLEDGDRWVLYSTQVGLA
ncbi:MAG TPA: hypothetical protein VFR26_13270, partial [Acidimicrobiales bacterium]|nr:hypothetical protein [Acidimicrobiales bacterium]